MKMAIEQSLVIIKPDGTVRRQVSALTLNEFLKNNLSVKAFKEFVVPREIAEKHYAVHRGKPFYDWLVDYITSAPVVVLVLEGENAIQKIRDLAGATFVEKAAPETLRGKYGIWKGLNVIHASDGTETANFEINLWTNEAKLITDNAEKLAKSYINKWINYNHNHTAELREVIISAYNAKEVTAEDKEQIFKLLLDDSGDIEEKYVMNLTNSIVELIISEINK